MEKLELIELSAFVLQNHPKSTKIVAIYAFFLGWILVLWVKELTFRNSAWEVFFLGRTDEHWKRAILGKMSGLVGKVSNHCKPWLHCRRETDINKLISTFSFIFCYFCCCPENGSNVVIFAITCQNNLCPAAAGSPTSLNSQTAQTAVTGPTQKISTLLETTVNCNPCTA